MKVKDIVAMEKESSLTARRTPYDIGKLANQIPTTRLNQFNKGILEASLMDTKQRVNDMADSMDRLVNDLRDIASKKK